MISIIPPCVLWGGVGVPYARRTTVRERVTLGISEDLTFISWGNLFPFL